MNDSRSARPHWRSHWNMGDRGCLIRHGASRHFTVTQKTPAGATLKCDDGPVVSVTWEILDGTVRWRAHRDLPWATIGAHVLISGLRSGPAVVVGIRAASVIVRFIGDRDDYPILNDELASRIRKLPPRVACDWCKTVSYVHVIKVRDTSVWRCDACAEMHREEGRDPPLDPPGVTRIFLDPPANSRWMRADGTSWRVIDVDENSVSIVCGSEYMRVKKEAWFTDGAFEPIRVAVPQQKISRLEALTRDALARDARGPGESKDAQLHRVLSWVEHVEYTKAPCPRRTPWPKYGRGRLLDPEHRTRIADIEADRAACVRHATIESIRKQPDDLVNRSDIFECTPYGAKITAGGCLSKRSEAPRPGKMAPANGLCRECRIGEVVASRVSEDGPSLVIAQLPPAEDVCTSCHDRGHAAATCVRSVGKSRPGPRRMYDQARLRALYEAGTRVADIAKQMGVSAGTVYNYLRDAGLSPTKPAPRKVPRVDDAEDDEPRANVASVIHIAASEETLIGLTLPEAIALDKMRDDDVFVQAREVASEGDRLYRQLHARWVKAKAEMADLESALTKLAGFRPDGWSHP